MIIKQITPTSFILTSSVTGKKIGLATKKETGYVLIQDQSKIFVSLDEIAEHFEETLNDNEDDKVPEVVINEIKGYPIKHKEVYIVESDDPDTNLHAYRSKQDGKVVHVAGYFGVKFSNGYVKKFCPRIETLLEYEYIGPYKDKFDMQFEILKYNREK